VNWQILQGDALETLSTLPSGSVHCCVTSPPYWGLRDYGMPGQLGLEPEPEDYVENMVAIFREVRRVLRDDGTLWLNMGDCYITEPHGPLPAGGRRVPWGRTSRPSRGANRSYRRDRAPVTAQKHRRPSFRLKNKDLVGMPWRVAFALQDDGWYLRKDIIWSKPNPMPESITDRPTSSHEYLFLFSKSGDSLYWTHRDEGRGTRKRPKPAWRWRHRDTREECDAEPAAQADDWMRFNLWTGHDYFYDADAIREPHVYGDHPRNGVLDTPPVQAPGQDVQSGITRVRQRGNRKTPAGWATGPEDHHASGRFRPHPNDRGLPPQPEEGGAFHPLGRNRRSVWTIATQPFPEAHFATFPEDLVAPCIQAGTSAVGVCASCGAPRERQARLDRVGPTWNQTGGKIEGGTRGDDRRGRQYPERYQLEATTVGWVATCECPPAPLRRALVLDPFCGSGRTGVVALRLCRRFLGIELSPEYVEMSKRLIEGDAPLFNRPEEGVV
jgi:DNA modification methylase